MKERQEEIDLISPEFRIPYGELGKKEVIRIDDGYFWDALEKIHEKAQSEVGQRK